MHVAGDGGGGFNFFNNGNDFSSINNGNWNIGGDDFFDFGDLAWNATFTTPVPEPTTLALLGTGLIGLVMMRRRKPNRAAPPLA
jgi:hypothetical protein